MDWNVTARLQVPHVREFQEDREVAAWFVLDLSGSVDFGSQQVRKRALASELVAVLARLFTRYGNRVGAVLHSEHANEVIPARSGRRHVLHILDRMVKLGERSAAPSPTGIGRITDLAELLATARPVIKRRSVLFVVSDFISTPGWSRRLADLARRHDIVAVRLTDPMERELPDIGLVVMQDAETGEQLLVDTHDKAFRRRFAQAAEKREEELRARTGRRRGRLPRTRDRRAARRGAAALHAAAQAPQPARGRRGAAAPPDLKARAMGDPTSFTFLWPTMLWLLLAVPLLMLVYSRVLKRRGALAARHARLETVGGAATSRLQRGLPPLLWLLGLTALILAVARPQAALVLPARIETVILALDMSGSMRATDLEPTRLAAAQNAAKAFVDNQPRHVKIGVVGIAASAALVQSPTDNREDIVKSIERLEPQRGTALGSGLAIALDAALPQARINVEEFINPPKGRKDEPRKKLEEREMTAGSNTAAAIVLLSDGQSNVGPDPLKAAELAAELRRAHLHGRHGHARGHDGQRRRLADARAARRGKAEAGRPRDRRRVLPRARREGAEADLQPPEREARVREAAADRDHVAVRRPRRAARRARRRAVDALVQSGVVGRRGARVP